MPLSSLQSDFLFVDVNGACKRSDVDLFQQVRAPVDTVRWQT